MLVNERKKGQLEGVTVLIGSSLDLLTTLVSYEGAYNLQPALIRQTRQLVDGIPSQNPIPTRL